MPHPWSIALAAFAVSLLASVRGASAQSCLGDLNNDGTVSGADAGILLGQWGQPGSADFDGNGVVGGADLGVLLGRWGLPCVTTPSWATLIEAQPDPAVVVDAALRSAIAATGRPWRVRHTATQIEMLLVPPGTYSRGCTPSNQTGCGTIESPVHQVTITNAFYMGRYEVTQAQWQAVTGSNPSYHVGATDSASRPVELVSWNAVQGFLSTTGLRLPTEGEWEYACRAKTTTAFHNNTGDEARAGEIAWFFDNSAFETRRVGTRAGNGLGFHDMSGNVWEWLSDWYGLYQATAQVNPAGPATGSFRVMRGGAWDSPAAGVRSSHRYRQSPGVADFTIGFRVAKAP